MLCDKRQFTQVPKWASQIQLLLLGSKFYFHGWSLCLELINSGKDRNFALHSLPGQSSAQGGLVFSMLSQQEPQLKHQGTALINGTSEATAEDTGSIGASYATILLLCDSFSSRAKHMIFHANHIIYMSSEMKWENRTSKEQRTYPLHRHSEEHNTMSL